MKCKGSEEMNYCYAAAFNTLYIFIGEGVVVGTRQ